MRGATKGRIPGVPALGDGVGLCMDASEDKLPLVAAVATGAAEALGLQLEPAVRLQTIAVEAAGNVVAHAYPSGGDSKLELQICREDGEVQIRVSDEGVGVQLPPAGGETPGLGLSIISTLAEEFSLRSGVVGGTRLEATIDPDAAPAARGSLRTTPPPHPSRLEFSDPAFLQPVLGRAFAAEMSGERLHLDRLEEALRVGDAIAERLAEDGAPLPDLEFTEGMRPHELLIRIAPAVAVAADRLAAALREALAAAIPRLRIGSDRGWTLLALPI
jgi:serine/threonine-protein kinase RsbW